jgi:hypothetical protein
MVIAQAGSTGGSIGKQGKSVSGGEEAPERKARTHEAAKPVGKPSAGISQASCNLAVGTWFWVTQEVTLQANGIADSRGGQGKWSCASGRVTVVWDSSSFGPERFTIAADGQTMTGGTSMMNWSPQRVR